MCSDDSLLAAIAFRSDRVRVLWGQKGQTANQIAKYTFILPYEKQGGMGHRQRFGETTE